jgi:hypothetical protein
MPTCDELRSEVQVLQPQRDEAAQELNAAQGDLDELRHEEQHVNPVILKKAQQKVNTAHDRLNELNAQMQKLSETMTQQGCVIVPPVTPVARFDANKNGFKFINDFVLSAPEAAELGAFARDQLVDAIAPGIISRFREAMSGLSFDILWWHVGLPDFVLGQVTDRVEVELAAEIINLGIDPIMNGVGFCGGMAFAGYDFYLQGWPVDIFGSTTPPEGTTLHDYIFSRLVDSLDLNATKFLHWLVELFVLPKLNEVADIAFGAAVGSIAAPLGPVVGAFLADHEHLFHFGGAGSLLSMTMDEWTAIKERLDQQAAWPIGLIFGNTANPIKQHQVLALCYTDDDPSPGQGTLTIWDNRSGNISDVLHLDFRGSELEVSGDNFPEAIKGIFIEDYTQKTPPSSLH